MNPRFVEIAEDIQRHQTQRLGWKTPNAIIDSHIWSVQAIRGRDALGEWTPEADAAFRARATR